MTASFSEKGTLLTVPKVGSVEISDKGILRIKALLEIMHAHDRKSQVDAISGDGHTNAGSGSASASSSSSSSSSGSSSSTSATGAPVAPLTLTEARLAALPEEPVNIEARFVIPASSEYMFSGTPKDAGPFFGTLTVLPNRSHRNVHLVYIFNGAFSVPGCTVRPFRFQFTLDAASKWLSATVVGLRPELLITSRVDCSEHTGVCERETMVISVLPERGLPPGLEPKDRQDPEPHIHGTEGATHHASSYFGGHASATDAAVHHPAVPAREETE